MDSENDNRPRLKSLSEMLRKPVGGKVIPISSYKKSLNRKKGSKKKLGLLKRLLKALTGD